MCVLYVTMVCVRRTGKVGVVEETKREKGGVRGREGDEWMVGGGG